MPAQHIVLLGDSIFDNGAYTAGAPDVVTHLRALLPRTCRTCLLAVDGSTTVDLAGQVVQVPRDATHLIIAIGGNDALLNWDLLSMPVSSTAAALSLFDARVSRFEHAYRTAIRAAIALNKTTLVCTIYNGRLEPREARLARIALMMFNDAILRTAFEAALPVIDLRLVCTEAEDYSNPIEPSGRGGRKIAGAIVCALGLAEDCAPPSHVYPGASRIA
jgi:hypothetical protein